MSTMTSAVDQKLDYLKLLVTELQNQNPLEPMQQKDMAAQLAQFSQLELTEEMNGNISTMNETMESMNTSFAGAMVMAKWDYAKSMLGKDIQFYDEQSGGNLVGHVQRVSFSDGQLVLDTVVSADGVNQTMFNVKLDQVKGVQL
ncbi:MAG: flagellar hook assembly protein FlgD [Planctomycetota bacterium]|jgi:flagellar hook assembly protein FlgD